MSEVEVFDALKYRVVVNEHGTRRYYNAAGQKHREHGPAVEFVSGHKEWHQNGQRHRIDGPAIECTDGSKYWYQYDIRHRTDGAAIECTNGYRLWFIHGVEMSQAEFNQRVKNV